MEVEDNLEVKIENLLLTFSQIGRIHLQTPEHAVRFCIMKLPKCSSFPLGHAIYPLLILKRDYLYVTCPTGMIKTRRPNEAPN